MLISIIENQKTQFAISFIFVYWNLKQFNCKFTVKINSNGVYFCTKKKSIVDHNRGSKLIFSPTFVVIISVIVQFSNCIWIREFDHFKRTLTFNFNFSFLYYSIQSSLLLRLTFYYFINLLNKNYLCDRISTCFAKYTILNFQTNIALRKISGKLHKKIFT